MSFTFHYSPILLDIFLVLVQNHNLLALVKFSPLHALFFICYLIEGDLILHSSYVCLSHIFGPRFHLILPTRSLDASFYFFFFLCLLSSCLYSVLDSEFPAPRPEWDVIAGCSENGQFC